mmetsp:Transcript_28328/g.34568  ORF Transcript_28328/g.34568 Transcript_28328/m.34568 type:complete len:347 (+) Transcript_28328:233-1273(+)
MNLRQSIGGILEDSTKQRSVRASSVPRRMSLSASSPFKSSPCRPNSAPKSEKKDRRVMLDEWRRQARSRNKVSPSSPTHCSISSSHEISSSKRFKIEDADNMQQQQQTQNHQHPPLPPSSVPTPASGENLSAVDRYRIRKQQKQQMLQQNDENTDPNRLPPQPPCIPSPLSPSPGGSRLGPALRITPKASAVGKGRRQSVSRINNSITKARRRSLSISRNTEAPPLPPSHSIERQSFPQPPPRVPKTMSTVPTKNDLDQDEPVSDSVVGVGLRSRISGMQERINQLEQEKITLSMSKAPLEARFRQKEDAWQKEQNKFSDKINDLKATAKDADERFRSLENKLGDL